MNDFKLYRFSPISSEPQLRNAIEHIHYASYKLLNHALDIVLPNAGNMGVFCHYDDEFDYLKQLRSKLCEQSDNPDLKYFKLNQPIHMAATNFAPAATYTHLYIRRPDPYRGHVGDIDFYMPPAAYLKLKNRIEDGEAIDFMRIFERPDVDMIELFDPDSDVLAYISTDSMARKVRIKLSDITKL